MPIGLDHPEGKTQLSEPDPPSKEAIPDRIGIGKNAQELQPVNWDLNDRAGKGQENPPEEPAPTVEHPVHQHAEQGDQGTQKQEHRPGVTRGRHPPGPEGGGIDRWLDGKNDQQARPEQAHVHDECFFQQLDGSRRCASHGFFPWWGASPGCKPSNSRKVSTSGSSSQRWAITSSTSNWSVRRPN